ncbi:MAG: U32 family peptidase [Proteobacteria bacterium]|nr:U32 family peptidase [Pseudomonadota bacterium]
MNKASPNTELLAPAGNLEKLIFAANFGADAVYFGLDRFSLRSFAGNFSLDDAAKGLDYLHARGKRGFCTLNTYPFDEEYAPLLEQAVALEQIGVDGIIVADLGVLAMLIDAGIAVPIHISTQANTVSSQTVEVYQKLGAKRVNLARELSLERIARIQEAASKVGIELEVFVHGSVCFSYSGRCAISDYLTGRRANRGECTNPCRWKYFLVEEKRPNEYMPVAEDERGLYFFNAKDLALFSYIGRLQELGISSFKIEGRMKTVHYIASVVSLYRRIMDGEEISEEDALALLGRVPNHGYSLGFMKGEIAPEDYSMDTSRSSANVLFQGFVSEKKIPGKSLVVVRNKIIAGEKVELLQPDGSIRTILLPSNFKNEKGEVLTQATHATILLPFELEPFSIIRKNWGNET